MSNQNASQQLSEQEIQGPRNQTITDEEEDMRLDGELHL